jgi:hypothetical protein
MMFLLVVAPITSAQLVSTSVRPSAQNAVHAGNPIHISRAMYHGWRDSLALRNGKVEVIIVPATGRVMQFHFVGEGDVLWENRPMDGRSPDPSAKEWSNFGGDKSWPAPQADWEKLVGRGWPPPTTFDAVAFEAVVEGTVVELVSPVDPSYGMRLRRRVELDPGQPIMSITTIYEKVQGSPVKVGIGVITQLRDPQRAFMVLPKKSRFAKGYVLLQFSLPQDLVVKDGLVSLHRGHRTESQIGTDASTLLWMDDKYVLRIESKRVKGAEYADQGSSAEIYTNYDPFAYVELETFGPLITMKVGDKIKRTNVYTLLRRSQKNPEAEAKRVLGRQR